jgi:hypothetical protein
VLRLLGWTAEFLAALVALIGYRSGQRRVHERSLRKHSFWCRCFSGTLALHGFDDNEHDREEVGNKAKDNLPFFFLLVQYVG